MLSRLRCPAAQYLRMSTELQRYSLENQSRVIEQYAENHGFLVTRTYSDSAKTGVVFRNRQGLQGLLRDVVQGVADYKAILVFDVSRWGRFQDSDEAAYYEFLCKAAGVPVHYCAETFANDNALPSVIMKSLKRVMAAEYSRELGIKVYAGQKTLAQRGFRQGGQPGYGLRRLLVSGDGTPKQLLHDGERKGLSTDRVVQVPGPADEVNCVREIYRMFIKERMNFSSIARELNRRQIKYLPGARWSLRAVSSILTHPKYSGCNVYGRCSQRLYTPTVKLPKSEWTLAPSAFEPLVDPRTFEQAQELLGGLTRNKTDEGFLAHLRAILAKHGKITIKLVENTPGIPSPNAYRARFGSFSNAYHLVGYRGFWDGTYLARARSVQRLRIELMKQIVEKSKGKVVIVRGATRHTYLRLRNGRSVAVLASRHLLGYKGVSRWLLKPVASERRRITLVARLNPQSDVIKDLFVIPPVGISSGVVVAEHNARLECGIQLHDLADFWAAVEQVALRGKRGIK